MNAMDTRLMPGSSNEGLSVEPSRSVPSAAAWTVSVVICAYTEARWDNLVCAVKSVQAQTSAPLEVVVVIDHNERLLERVRSALQDVVLIENLGPRGLSDARNSGVRCARGEVIALLDDDAMAEPDWLERLVGPYGDPRIMGVGGVIAPLWLTRRPPWFPEEFNWVIGCSYRGLPQTTAPVRNLIGTNMSFRKEILDTIGGFRSGMGRVGTRPLGCEETEFCIRASEHWPEKRWLYEPLAAVRHRVPSSRASWDYFRARCFAEGISKASVSGYVGQREGLATERDYAVRALPLGVLHGVLDALVRRDRAGLAKAGAIVVGFALATAGYLAGITFGVALPFRRKPAL